MSSVINTIGTYPPSIGFSITKDGGTLSDYVLSWNGKSGATNGSQTFNLLSGGQAFTVPVNTPIKFTPNFANLPSNNKIIQHKWSFGDGRTALIMSPLAAGNDGSIYHTYDSGLVPVSTTTTCFIATLTAIDQYQRHVRAYKTIYLYTPSS